MNLVDVKDNMVVEWSFGGLAVVMGEPFRKYRADYVKILPMDTGDASTGTGLYSRQWPVAQLRAADMTVWTLDADRKVWTKTR